MSRKRYGQRKTIIKDGVKASDFNNLNIIYCCEQCSYFEIDKQKCNFGYRVEEHRQQANIANFELGGRMAFCRFQEID